MSTLQPPPQAAQLSDRRRHVLPEKWPNTPQIKKQSAVMACLAIVQQEQGCVSAESEQAIGDYLGMAADCRA